MHSFIYLPVYLFINYTHYESNGAHVYVNHQCCRSFKSLTGVLVIPHYYTSVSFCGIYLDIKILIMNTEGLFSHPHNVCTLYINSSGFCAFIYILFAFYLNFSLKHQSKLINVEKRIKNHEITCYDLHFIIYFLILQYI